MHEVFILALKGLAGGLLVVSFALRSEMLEPKRFSGLFGAAPAVALAGLTIVLLDKGHHDAHQNAVGMAAGCAGMIAYAACAVPLLRRHKAPRAAVMALMGWFALAALATIPVVLA